MIRNKFTSIKQKKSERIQLSLISEKYKLSTIDPTKTPVLILFFSSHNLFRYVLGPLKNANAVNIAIIARVKNNVNFDGEIINVGRLKIVNKRKSAPIAIETMAFV